MRKVRTLDKTLAAKPPTQRHPQIAPLCRSRMGPCGCACKESSGRRGGTCWGPVQSRPPLSRGVGRFRSFPPPDPSRPGEKPTASAPGAPGTARGYNQLPHSPPPRRASRPHGRAPEGRPEEAPRSGSRARRPRGFPPRPGAPGLTHLGPRAVCPSRRARGALRPRGLDFARGSLAPAP